MNTRTLASAIVLWGVCVPAFAQTTQTPATETPPAAERQAEREAARRSEQPAVPPRNDPNTTGDDKINGLEVPAMKDGEKRPQ